MRKSTTPRWRHWAGAWVAGMVIGITLGTYPYKTQSYIIGKTMADVDVIHVTMFINLGGVLVTKSHATYAKITCFDISIEPATILQTCHQDHD